MNHLDATFSALGDGTRRAILAHLCEGEQPLSQLAQPFDMSLTAVSKHVRVLEEAGLVRVEKRGRTRHCQLQGAALQEASGWLDEYRRFWEQRFDELDGYLAEIQSKEKGHGDEN